MACRLSILVPMLAVAAILRLSPISNDDMGGEPGGPQRDERQNQRGAAGVIRCSAGVDEGGAEKHQRPDPVDNAHVPLQHADEPGERREPQRGGQPHRVEGEIHGAVSAGVV